MKAATCSWRSRCRENSIPSMSLSPARSSSRKSGDNERSNNDGKESGRSGGAENNRRYRHLRPGGGRENPELFLPTERRFFPSRLYDFGGTISDGARRGPFKGIFFRDAHNVWKRERGGCRSVLPGYPLRSGPCDREVG